MQQPKILTCLVILLLGTQLAHAQFQKGTFVAGAQASFGMSKNDQFTNVYFTPTVSGGYMLVDNLELGVRATASARHFSRTGGDRFTEITSYSTGIYGHYYFGKGKLRPFVIAGVDYGYRNTDDLNFVDFRAGGGLLYQVNSRLGLTLEHTVSHSRFSNGTSNTNFFGTRLGLRFRIGGK